MKTFLADSGLFGLDLSADAYNAKNVTLLMLYQPVTMLSKKQYTSEGEEDKLMRNLYEKFLLLVSIRANNKTSIWFLCIIIICWYSFNDLVFLSL